MASRSGGAARPSQQSGGSGKPSATRSNQAELDALVKEYMATVERQRQLRERIDVLMREREAEIESKMQNMAKEKLALRNIHEELRGKLHRANMDEHTPPPVSYLSVSSRARGGPKVEEDEVSATSSSSDDLAESPRRTVASPHTTRRVFPARPQAVPDFNHARSSNRASGAGQSRRSPTRGRPTTAGTRYNPY
ncbi:hypothetical protein FRC17_005272 [Serendipita sp. 399]|nr:hypothetical protein FRC17_005272 [Serendipita sp. 399]